MKLKLLVAAAYAALGTALGYKVTLCLPANATEERKKLMRLYGAEIIETTGFDTIFC